MFGLVTITADVKPSRPVFPDMALNDTFLLLVNLYQHQGTINLFHPVNKPLCSYN